MRVSDLYDMPTDKQYNGQLIDEYYRLKSISEIAKRENATETVEAINKQLAIIKLKLQPIELEE